MDELIKCASQALNASHGLEVRANDNLIYNSSLPLP
jgi:hypothetical protein